MDIASIVSALRGSSPSSRRASCPFCPSTSAFSRQVRRRQTASAPILAWVRRSRARLRSCSASRACSWGRHQGRNAWERGCEQSLPQRGCSDSQSSYAVSFLHRHSAHRCSAARTSRQPSRIKVNGVAGAFLLDWRFHSDGRPAWALFWEHPRAGGRRDRGGRCRSSARVRSGLCACRSSFTLGASALMSCACAAWYCRYLPVIQKRSAAPYCGDGSLDGLEPGGGALPRRRPTMVAMRRKSQSRARNPRKPTTIPLWNRGSRRRRYLDEVERLKNVVLIRPRQQCSQS